MAQNTYIARKGKDADFANLTVSGTLTVTGETDLTVDLDVADDQDVRLGTGNDTLLRFSTADASNHTTVIALDNTSQQIHITDAGAVATDWNRSAGTHPEVAIHSNTTPATDYLAIGNHDGTTASIDVVGGTTLNLSIAGTPAVAVTATAVLPTAGSDIGSTSAEIGNVYVADDKKVFFGSDQDASIEYDEDGTDQLRVVGSTIFQSGVVNVTAASGVTTFGPIVKLEETVAYSAFTDGGAAVGTYDITVGTIPAGATFLYSAVTAVTGFAGDVSAALTIGDGTDVDRYNTSTIDVFSTAANGVAAGDPSGTRYHDAAKTVKLTVTTNADYTSVSAGSVTVELYYLT